MFYHEMTKKFRFGSEFPSGRLILVFKEVVEDKDGQDGATSLVQIIACWDLPFTDLNLVSSACGNKS